MLPDGARHGSAQLTTSSRVKRRGVTAKNVGDFARISVPKPLPKPRLKPNVLHRPEFDKFYGHDPFLQESAVVSNSMVLRPLRSPVKSIGPTGLPTFCTLHAQADPAVVAGDFNLLLDELQRSIKTS